MPPCPHARTLSAALLVLLAAAASAATVPGRFSGFSDDLGQANAAAQLKRPLRLLAFGYTSCPDVCPLTLLAMHQGLEQLGAQASEVDPMFVTVDPERDSLSKLHGYVTAFDARIRGYNGNDEALNRLTSSLKVRYWREALYPDSSDYSMSHTATLFVLSRDGRLLARIDHADQADVLASRIAAAIRRVEPHAAAR